MACAPCSGSSIDQFKCWLDELKIPYIDCDGTVQGDCSICAGAGNSGTQTNTVAFNPGNNQITTVVDGIASSAVLTFDTGDITLFDDLTINSVLYPAGASLHTVLTAIVALGHPALSTHGGNNPALSLNSGTQVIRLDLTTSGSYDNTTSGLTADNIQDAIDEVSSVASGLPSGSIGDILMHDGTTFVPVQEVTEEITGITTATINLANPPLAFPPRPFRLFRGGQLVSSPGDYTRIGQVITLTSAALAWEMFDAEYYV